MHLVDGSVASGRGMRIATDREAHDCSRGMERDLRRAPHLYLALSRHVLAVREFLLLAE